MYPWYRESVQQFCGGATSSPMPATIKTENGYNDCMLSALDYAAQSKKAALVWGEGGGQHGTAGGSGHTKSGGAQGGQGAGLVHWMSVMAEHMNTVSGSAPHHHDAVHYMWNGGVDQCGAHGKDVEYSWTRQSMAKQEYESKMNSVDQQNSQGLHKEEGSDRWFGRHFWKGPWKPSYSAGGVEDGRMESVVPGGGGIGTVYGGGRSHSSSSSSASPPHGQAMLVVPHPLTSTKDQHHVVTQNGSGRKYQCKMCPLMPGAGFLTKEPSEKQPPNDQV